ncbi:MAG: hypothetical protein ACQXXF_07965 [Thermoplasmatota archaeon]
MKNINNNKKSLKLLTLTLVIISLIIPSSTIIAGNVQKPQENEKTLNILINDVDEKNCFIQKEVSEKKYKQLNIFVTDILTYANNSMDENSPGGKNITGIEWDEIEKGIIKIIDVIKELVGDEFPYETTKTFITSLINLFHGPLYIVRQPLLSIGIGVSWIPRYDYETFLGKMIRPVFIRHLIGFSATARLNPFQLGFVYWYFGFQRIRTFLFKGLLINFADLGINRLIGPQLLIGYGVFTGIIH